MAKRRKKKRNPARRKATPDAFSVAEPGQLRRLAEADLAAGNGRRAREGFRRLLRLGEPGALEDYLKATAQYLETLFQEKRTNQVRDVLNQVHNLAGEQAATWCEPWECRLSLADGKSGGNTGKAWSYLQGGGTDSWAVDAVVLSFETPESEDDLVRDVRGIHQGLHALVERDAERLEQVLKGIGRRSLVAGWKWLLKGWGSLLDPSDVTKACRCFENAGSDGAAGKIASLMRSVHGDRPLEAEEASALCLWLGEGKLAPVMPKIEALWKEGRVRRAYETLHRVVPFPRMDSSPVGNLTPLFLVSTHLSPSQFQSLGCELQRRAEGNRLRDDHEKACLFLWAAKHCDEPDPETYEDYWLGFLQAYENLNGKSPALAARVHERIARGLFIELTDKEPDGDEQEMILKHCKRSDALAPARSSLYRLWLEVLNAGDLEAEGNRLLDKAVKAFPNEPMFLMEAGVRACARKAMNKGANYLKKALQLDPLQKPAREMLLSSLVVSIHQDYRSRRIAPARKRFDEMRRFALDDISHPGLNRAYVELRQAILEEGLPKPDTSVIERCDEAAKERLPYVVYTFARNFFGHLFFNPSGHPPRLKFWKVMRKLRANTHEAVLLAKFLAHHEFAKSQPYFKQFVDFFDDYLQALSRGGDIQREQMRELIFVMEERKGVDMPTRLMEAAQKKCPEEPLFNLALIKRGKLRRDTLSQWMTKAREARDHRVVAYGERLEQSLEERWGFRGFGGFSPFGGGGPFGGRRPSGGGGPFGGVVVHAEDLDDLEDEDLDDEDDEDDEESLGIPGPKQAALEELILSMRSAPRPVIREMCEMLGLSPKELDRLIDDIQEERRRNPRREPVARKAAPPERKPTPKKPPLEENKEPSKEDPTLAYSQGELFGDP